MEANEVIKLLVMLATVYSRSKKLLIANCSLKTPKLLPQGCVSPYLALWRFFSVNGPICTQTDGYRAGEIHHCLSYVCNLFSTSLVVT